MMVLVPIVSYGAICILGIDFGAMKDFLMHLLSALITFAILVENVVLTIVDMMKN